MLKNEKFFHGKHVLYEYVLQISCLFKRLQCVCISISCPGQYQNISDINDKVSGGHSNFERKYNKLRMKK